MIGVFSETVENFTPFMTSLTRFPCIASAVGCRWSQTSIKIWSNRKMILVTFHVSDPYNLSLICFSEL